MGNIRKQQKKNYTQVSNIVLNDNTLSLKAKGLYAFMDSKPEGWNFTYRSISKQVKEGEDSVRTALNELKEYGYITYRKHTNGTGTYELYDNPSVENPSVENPKRAKPTRISNTDLRVKQIVGQPTEDQVIDIGIKLGGSKESCIRFYNFYSAKGWKGILDFIPLLRNWIDKDKQSNIKENKKVLAWG